MGIEMYRRLQQFLRDRFLRQLLPVCCMRCRGVGSAHRGTCESTSLRTYSRGCCSQFLHFIFSSTFSLHWVAMDSVTAGVGRLPARPCVVSLVHSHDPAPAPNIVVANQNRKVPFLVIFSLGKLFLIKCLFPAVLYSASSTCSQHGAP